MCFWKIGSTVPSYPCPLCIINSIVFPPKKKPFPLLRLPTIPLRLITKMMNAEEILNLSMCSYRLEFFLRASRHKMVFFSVHVSHQHMSYSLETPDTMAMSFKIGVGKKQVNYVDKMGLLSGSLIQENGFIRFNQPFLPDEMLKIYRRIISLYTPSFIRWVFHFNELPIDNFFRYLIKNLTEMSNCDQTMCHKFSLQTGSLRNETLMELMDWIPVTAKVEIDADLSLDFKHANAFKYKTIEYKEGRWATLDDLKSVRNEWIVDLKSTNFDCHDINEFLKYWVDCDEAILTRLTLKLKEGTVIDEAVLTDQLTILLYYEDELPQFFIKVKKIVNEQLVIGHFETSENNIVNFNVGPPNQYPEIYEILVSMEKVKELEEELLRIDRGEEPNEEIRERNRRKREIEEDLREVRRRIDELNEYGLILRN
ncbi:hypothetical protein GCK72_004700 [Caenorhabditis remanei]|uniref:F-box domain-containing protein n=1 Tax=Caenorhabditis remanei TaxID=31234 RepID=A0A6A5HAA2_CAERE|nr:hypothetical protein GCK72_004700 [Caenorhabditis remanei]KAF1764750.1 hypothetical protein GCK72_004700 [Caenorhabditis remanei]